MMEIPKELTTIISLTSNGMIWIYIVLFFALSYLIISLLTWNLITPMKYLGIPTIIVGIVLLIIRFSSSILINLIKDASQLNLIKILLPSVLKPLLLTGVCCFIIGIVMVVIYNILNKKVEIRNT